MILNHLTCSTKSKFRPKLWFPVLAALLTLVLLIRTSEAAVTVTTSGTGAGGNITITLPPIHFTAIRGWSTSLYSSGALGLVFDDAVPNPGGGDPYNQSSFDGFFTGPLLSGGRIDYFYEGGDFFGEVTVNDAAIVTFDESTNPFQIGDTVVYEGGTVMMLQPYSDFDVFASGTYEVFLISYDGTRLTENGMAVPEPSSSVLIGVSTLVFMTHRRRLA